MHAISQVCHITHVCIQWLQTKQKTRLDVTDAFHLEISNPELIQFILRGMHYNDMLSFLYIGRIPFHTYILKHSSKFTRVLFEEHLKISGLVIRPLAGSTLKPSPTYSQCQLSGISLSTKPWLTGHFCLVIDIYFLGILCFTNVSGYGASLNTMSVALSFPTHHRYRHCWVWHPGIWVCTYVYMQLSWHTWRGQSQVLGTELTMTVLLEKHLYLLCHLSHQPSIHI